MHRWDHRPRAGPGTREAPRRSRRPVSTAVGARRAAAWWWPASPLRTGAAALPWEGSGVRW